MMGRTKLDAELDVEDVDDDEDIAWGDEADAQADGDGDGLTEDARVAILAITDMVKATQAPSAPTPKQLDVRWLAISAVRVDGGTQSRVRLDPKIVQDYAQDFSGNIESVTTIAGKTNSELWWGDFPPLDVYFDQEYWLADGFHRLAGLRQALERAGLDSYRIREWRAKCRVFLGSRRDAILHAAGANSNHGLRRTNADKRKSVELLLRDEEWRQWTNPEIAKACAVDPKTVGNIRNQLELSREIPDSLIRKRADGATVDTTNIGANQRKIEPLRKPTPTPTVELTEPVYIEPPVLNVAIADAIVSDLYQADLHGDAFKAALQQATLAQLEHAIYLCSSDADPRRYLKLGNRRELLLVARDGEAVDFDVCPPLRVVELETSAGKASKDLIKAVLPTPSSINAINRDLDAYDAAAEREAAEWKATPLEQAIQEATETPAAAQPDPAPEPKTLSALFPDDDELRRAKFVIRETDQGWRYFNAGSKSDGPMRSNKEDAIADAKWALAAMAPDPVVTAGFIDTGKGAQRAPRKLKTAGLEHINAMVTEPAPVDVAELAAVDALPVWEYSGVANLRIGGYGGLSLAIYGLVPDQRPDSGEYEITLVLVRRTDKVSS